MTSNVSLGAPMFLAALAILIPVLLTFLVRKQRRVMKVPSTMLWRLGAKSISKSRRIRDVRRLIALLACLAGVGALALAAARPGGKRATSTVYVVDVSGSMAGRPIDEARHFIRREVTSLGPNGRVAIITAGHEPRVLLPPTAPGPLLDQALASLAAERENSSLDEALALAEGMHAHVVVISDHAVEKEASHYGWTEQHVVGQGRSNNKGGKPDNVGITSLFTHTAPDAHDDEEREATIVVATSSTSTRRARLSVSFAGHVVSERSIEIPAQGEATENITVRGPGKLVAKVASDDGRADTLDIDNEATLDETARRPPRIALIRQRNSVDAPGYFFIMRALEAAGVTDISDLDVSDTPPKNAEVAVVLQDGPARPKDIPQLFIGGAIPPEYGVQPMLIGRERAHLRSIATEDPLMRGVALDELTSMHARIATPPKGARSLVDLDGGPALIAGGAGPDAWVWLGIDPEASDLVLRVAFPVLVGNMLSHLGGASSVIAAKTLPRDEVMLAEASSDTKVEAALPDAAEPHWRIPASPPALIALFGAVLLAFELWFSFRRRAPDPKLQKKTA